MRFLDAFCPRPENTEGSHRAVQRLRAVYHRDVTAVCDSSMHSARAAETESVPLRSCLEHLLGHAASIAPTSRLVDAARSAARLGHKDCLTRLLEAPEVRRAAIADVDQVRTRPLCRPRRLSRPPSPHPTTRRRAAGRRHHPERALRRRDPIDRGARFARRGAEQQPTPPLAPQREHYRRAVRGGVRERPARALTFRGSRAKAVSWSAARRRSLFRSPAAFAILIFHSITAIVTQK
eukprot:SAG11_NODE_2196_length_3699_cov_2.962222_2_plen_236_part_00